MSGLEALPQGFLVYAWNFESPSILSYDWVFLELPRSVGCPAPVVVTGMLASVDWAPSLYRMAAT